MRIDYDGNSTYGSWECVTFYFDTPDTSKLGNTTVIGYLDVHKLELQEQCEFEYRDAWGRFKTKFLCAFLQQLLIEKMTNVTFSLGTFN